MPAPKVVGRQNKVQLIDLVVRGGIVLRRILELDKGSSTYITL